MDAGEARMGSGLGTALPAGDNSTALLLRVVLQHAPDDLCRLAWLLPDIPN